MPNFWRRSAAYIAVLATVATPALAHHGKDFLLTETDDMPQPSHVYATLSSDTNIEADGTRSNEITPGLLFAIGDHVTIEPHFHVTKTAEQDYHYDATAIGVRYNLGYLPKSDIRFAISGEYEKPKDSEENSNGLLRVIFVRTLPSALVAVNLTAGRDLVSDASYSYGLNIGILKPLANGDGAGIELAARMPFRDGYELVPGYYHRLSDASTVKAGIGLFHSDATTAGTLHLQFIQRF